MSALDPNAPKSDPSEIDAQNRHLAQEAGLDRDLESQVPPIYGQFTSTVLVVIAIVSIGALLWMFL